jgi:disulfide bond formation protein DsbB/mono/diheme cytochrome c family protein
MNSESMNYWLDRSALYIALLVAWVATVGSLYFSEVLGYIPCQLCWYQRILMYPLAGLLALGLLRFDINLPYLVIPFTIVGGTISAYHYLLQKTSLFDGTITCQVGVPCSTAWINWFGFVTIPFLALLAFFLITVFSLVALFANEPQRHEDQSVPWLPVGAVIGTVVIVFVASALMNQQTRPAVALADHDDGIMPFLPTPIATITGQAVSAGDSAVESTSFSNTDAGEELYMQACAACHGADAAGIENLGNSLLTSGVLLLPDAEALAFIRKGVDLSDPHNSTGLVMPASGGRPDLTDKQLISILQYLRADATIEPVESP